jgi:hypothetical protein
VGAVAEGLADATALIDRRRRKRRRRSALGEGIDAIEDDSAMRALRLSGR